MREIKFRAWIKSKKQWVKADDNKPGLLLEHARFWNDWEDTKDIEVMQYTGLKDKNGTEIYFGDVILAPYGRYKYDANEDCDASKILDMIPSVIIYPEDSKKWFHKAYSPDPLMLLAQPTLGEKTFRKRVSSRHYMFPTHSHESEVIGNIYENPELVKPSTKKEK